MRGGKGHGEGAAGDKWTELPSGVHGEQGRGLGSGVTGCERGWGQRAGLEVAFGGWVGLVLKVRGVKGRRKRE